VPTEQTIQHDYPGAVFLLRQGASTLSMKETNTNFGRKVIGDLWESYLRLLDDGVADG